VIPSWIAETTDKDGLYDLWETSGIDINGDGMLENDLRALGANPMHKDLFVEIDAMVGRAQLASTLRMAI
jgi:hypothetical protein